jgi:hypothetical protein
MHELEEEFKPISDYQKRKHEVMSEEERTLAEKNLDFYRSAHKDKDNRGLFDKWESIDLYWEGDANPPESDTDPASNTNIVNSNIEGQVAYLVEQNIAIEAKPRGPSDRPFKERAVIVMEFVKEQNRMKRKLDVHERRRKKFGTGIFRVLFDPDKLDGMGLPVIDPCNPAYVMTDPTITDVYRYQEGRFIIDVVNRSLNYARENYDEELANAIEPGYHPMEAPYLFGEESGQTDEISKDSYLHMFVFTRYKTKDGERRLRLVEQSGCGVILRDTKKEEEESGEAIFPDDRYPYFLTPDMYREGTVWGKSTAELLIPTQDIIDDLDDQIRMNARATGNPQRELDINSGIDPEKVTNETGLVYPKNGPERAITNIEPPRMPEYIIARRNLALQYERTIVSRFSDQMNGIKQEGVDTATESLGLQQGGTQGINHSKLLLEETLAEVFEYCLVLCMEYWTEEQFFELTERPGDYEYFRPSDLKQIPRLIPATDTYKTQFATDFPDAETSPQFMPLMGEDMKPITKRIALDISVTVGAGLPSNKAFVFNMIDKAHQAQAITPQEYRKLMREYTGLPIDEEPPITQDQVAQMVQQAVQQALQGSAMGGSMAAPSPMVQGLTAGNNPALSLLQGGGM